VATSARRELAHEFTDTTTIRGGDGRGVFTHTERRARTESKEKSAVFLHAMTIPLAGIQPARYLLTLDASSTSNAARHVSRQIPFAVH
jgi:hypothetical protein